MMINEDYETFGLVSLMAELGGLMGLLLGFSVLGIVGRIITRKVF